ncbi:MAG: PilZ domain-containing protein [Candidatus Omnitrophica bacterium]|nr:PilZ domain-containing protein [Candidatus Omnitrophota bacterium]
MAMPAASSIQERRQFARSEWTARVAINLLRTRRSIVADPVVNISEGGLCLRLQEELQVRSLVQMQLTATAAGGSSERTGQGTAPESLRTGRPVRCTGRVTWVVQRLDLREAPPFLFDVGIEFVDPPPLLRRLLVQRGAALTSKSREPHTKTLEASIIRGRRFVPRLERSSRPPLRWHLVVSVDGVPCFSSHFASEQEALAAWARFKRQQAKR